MATENTPAAAATAPAPETKIDTPAAATAAPVVEAEPKVGETKTEPAKAALESMVTKTDEAAKPKEEVPAANTAKPAVPEKYDLKLPTDSKLGTDVVAKIETLAKEKGWSNERAQEAIDERSQWQAEAAAAQSQQIMHLNDKEWPEQLAKDPDVGGQKFEESGHLAYKAAERFGGKAFADELKTLKLNHQPLLFKYLVSVGRAMESDKGVFPNINSPGKSNLPKEQQMYPDMYKTKEK